MIFLSYSHGDKQLVDPIAHRIGRIFGQDRVFYDHWSIRPGDAIVDRMDSALAQCAFFVLFVSRTGMKSGMVRQEWQSAFIRLASGATRVIPIRLDDCVLPPLLQQYLYIDMFVHGAEVAVRQLTDAIGNAQAFAPPPAIVSNLKAKVSLVGRTVVVECFAEHYLEPSSGYMFVVDNAEAELAVEYRSGSLCTTRFLNGICLSDGTTHNAVCLQLERATSPGFPVVVAISPTTHAAVRLVGVMHERTRDTWVAIPVSDMSVIHPPRAPIDRHAHDGLSRNPTI